MTDEQYRQLLGLLSDRAEIADQMATLKCEKEAIEAQISLLLDPDAPPVKVPGFGSLAISKPTVATLFDADALRELIQSLRETGNGDIADEIAACTKQTMRAGGLRVMPERDSSSSHSRQ